jgi:hypothetical protein
VVEEGPQRCEGCEQRAAEHLAEQDAEEARH